MEKGRHGARLMVLLIIGILFLGHLLTGRMRRETFSTTDSCKRLLNKIQHVNVKDKSLRDVIKLCSTDGIMLPDNRFNFSYLKHYLRKFNCPRSWKYLEDPKPFVALASYPGSGNTWVRELITTATGLHTGSVYKGKLFVGSQRCPARGKVFIIKTHFQGTWVNHRDCARIGVSNLSYSKAVVIIRNPYHAILAEYNRQNVGNPKNAKFDKRGVRIPPRDVFSSEKWSSFVIRESNTWKDMILYWITKSKTPVYLLVYERLRENTILEVYKMMEFVNITVSFNSLYCLSSSTTGNYHRVKPEWMTMANLYDKKMRKTVNAVIETVREKVGLRKNITDVLQSYLLPAE